MKLNGDQTRGGPFAQLFSPWRHIQHLPRVLIVALTVYLKFAVKAHSLLDARAFGGFAVGLEQDGTAIGVGCRQEHPLTLNAA